MGRPTFLRDIHKRFNFSPNKLEWLNVKEREDRNIADEELLVKVHMELL